MPAAARAACGRGATVTRAGDPTGTRRRGPWHEWPARRARADRGFAASPRSTATDEPSVARGPGHRHDPVRQQDRLVDVVRDHHRRDRPPGSEHSRASSCCRFPRVSASSAPNGSSRNSISGSVANARAIATRWRMPPDSCLGRRCSALPRPTSSEIALCLRVLLRARPRRKRGVHGQPHVLERREPRQQRIVLEDDRRLPGDSAERLAVDRDRCRRRAR